MGRMNNQPYIIEYCLCNNIDCDYTFSSLVKLQKHLKTEQIMNEISGLALSKKK